MTASTSDAAPGVAEQAAALANSFGDEIATRVERPSGAPRSVPGYRWYMLSDTDGDAELVAMIAVREESGAQPVESPFLQALAQELRAAE